MLHCTFFGLVIDMPVVVHVKVVVYPVVAQMQRSYVLTVQKNKEIPQLQSIDQVLDVPVAQVQLFTGAGREKSIEIPQLHSFSSLDKVVHTPVVCNDRCRMLQTSENCEGPAVAVLMNPWSMSLLCWSAAQFLDVVDVPVIIQRRLCCAVLGPGG